MPIHEPRAGPPGQLDASRASRSAPGDSESDEEEVLLLSRLAEGAKDDVTSLKVAKELEIPDDLKIGVEYSRLRHYRSCAVASSLTVGIASEPGQPEGVDTVYPFLTL